MPVGANKVSVGFVRKSLNGDYAPSRTYRYVLSSASFASINANTVAGVSAVAGVLASAGSYVNGTTVSGVTLTLANNDITFNCNSIEITSNVLNPTTARTLIVYADTASNGTQVASTDVVAVLDLTTDGSTPVVLVNGMVFNFNIAGVYRVTVNV